MKSIRLMCLGAFMVGTSLLGAACTPTAEAQQSSGLREESSIACGGLAGTPCPEGYTCVDDPTDDCDPEQGGRDCIGVCKQEPNPTGCDDPNRTYVSHDPDQCAAIRFTCDPGKAPFFDSCGCGCEPTP